MAKKEKKCSSSTQKQKHFSVVSNPGSIDMKNSDNEINSIQFINPTGSQELLILSGDQSLDCRIYEMKGSDQSPAFELRQLLEFENSGRNCCLVKGKYFFTMK
jgi:hypothetical protein